MTRERILVVEDDAPIAAALRRALSYAGYQVEVAGDGVAGLEAAAARLPDLVVLDLMLPELDGLEVCRRLRAGGDVPVLVLTARDAVGDRVEGLDAGADDYLVKPFANEELLARVRALLRRAAPRQSDVLRFADVELDNGSREVHRGGRRLRLTVLEFGLLEHLLRNQRLVLTRSQLREAVWGIDLPTASNVVDVYVRYLRGKLEAEGEPRLVQTVRGVGYVLREE